MANQTPSWTNDLLKKAVRRQGISQAYLAEKVQASQSQISRILCGKTSASSKLAQDVASYVFMQSSRSTRDHLASNDDLMDALEAAWDGTPAHARALAAVIRSLALLTPNERQAESTDA